MTLFDLDSIENYIRLLRKYQDGSVLKLEEGIEVVPEPILSDWKDQGSPQVESVVEWAITRGWIVENGELLLRERDRKVESDGNRDTNFFE